MKKYIFKIDTPWGKKGDKAPSTSCFHFTPDFFGEDRFEPSDFPEIFEEKESDEERVEDWLKKNYGKTWDNISKKLLAAGLRVDDLEKEKS